MIKHKNIHIHQILLICFCILIIFFIFSNSLANGTISTKRSDFFIPVFEDLGVSYQVSSLLIRKLGHILEFALLSYFLNFTFSSFIQTNSSIFYSTLFAFIIAIADECIQSFIPNRSSQIQDVFIDGIGIVVGLILFLSIRYWIKKKKN